MRSKFTYLTILFCSLTIFSWLILTEAHPVDDDIESSLGFTSNEVSKDSSADGSQTQTTTRPKRTIGFLRQLFPGISQVLIKRLESVADLELIHKGAPTIVLNEFVSRRDSRRNIIDRKIQAITRAVFRIVGRLILRGGNRNGGNSGGAGSDGSGGRRISITLPTYPPIEDEDDTEAPTEQTALPDLRFGGSNSTGNSSDSSITTPSSSDSPASTDTPESNTIVRKTRDVSDGSETTVSFDDESSPSEASTKRQGLLQRLNEMRKKRGSAGSGGGSGNFILDLIRLVAGSGVPPEKDEELNAPREERDENAVDGTDPTGPTDTSEDNYSAGIPGPLTRLFVLANRGLSNLIQDLILRLAQTSERIVNFKARLITAII